MLIVCNGQCPQLFNVYYFKALCAVTEGASVKKPWFVRISVRILWRRLSNVISCFEAGLHMNLTGLNISLKRPVQSASDLQIMGVARILKGWSFSQKSRIFAFNLKYYFLCSGFSRSISKILPERGSCSRTPTPWRRPCNYEIFMQQNGSHTDKIFSDTQTQFHLNHVDFNCIWGKHAGILLFVLIEHETGISRVSRNCPESRVWVTCISAVPPRIAQISNNSHTSGLNGTLKSWHHAPSPLQTLPDPRLYLITCVQLKVISFLFVVAKPY
jgi:hypothetical protein